MKNERVVNWSVFRDFSVSFPYTKREQIKKMIPSSYTSFKFNFPLKRVKSIS